MNDIETRLNNLAAWQYLNVATFVGVVAILVMMLF
jgi:hypothetical protein